MESQTFYQINEAFTLCVPIRVRERMLGLLILDRTKGDLVFTGRERRRLTRIAPYIVRALTPSKVLHAPWVDTDEEGLIIAEACGRMRHLTPEAQRLLYLANTPGGIATPGTDTMLPEPILRLCNTLAHPPSDENTASVTETWVHENSLGRFIFRVHRLGPAREFPHLPLMGITVRRQEPLPLKLLRRIDKLPLSFREMQFCLVMVSGYCQTAIARHMNISEHTAIAHRRHIYTKLAVHNRAELMSKLLAL